MLKYQPIGITLVCIETIQNNPIPKKDKNLRWCIHLSRSLLYFNYLVSVTAGGPIRPRGHM